MANKLPSPVLDDRNGDLIVAQAIGSMPAELSDRSNSNPAVVILEAMGAMFDRLIYQINRWPKALVQKLLALIGVTLNPETPATVQQTFVLSTPQPRDIVVPAGTKVSTSDGAYVFETQADLTIPAYVNGVGSIILTAGSTAVTGVGTSFTSIPVGYQIATNISVWYTVQSVSSNTALTLKSSAVYSDSGAFYVGPLTGTTNVKSQLAGLVTNLQAGLINTLVTQPSGVASTYNASSATGGNDEEAVDDAVDRCPEVLNARDIALSTGDFEYFARRVLGQNSRAKAFANTNLIYSANGYVTTALLSPAWTSVTPVSAQERAAVDRDLASRRVIGCIYVDVPADIQAVVPGVAFWRRAEVDATTVRLNVAAALNSLLNPSTYDWGRTIYTADLIQAVETAEGVDRVHAVNGIPAVGSLFAIAANPISFVNGSTSATANAADIGVGKITKNVTYLFDVANSCTYLVTNISGTTLTLDSGYSGTTGAVASVPYLNVGDKALNYPYSLPYSSLSSTAVSPSIQIAGVV